MASEWAAPIQVVTTPRSMRERVRRVWLLLPMLTSIGALLISLLALDWFTARLPEGQLSGFGGVNELSIDLHSVSTCATQRGPFCQTPLGYMAQYPGFHPYTTLSSVTYWAGLIFAGFILLQAGLRFLGDWANRILTIIGCTVGCLTIACACTTAYVYGPEFSSFAIRPTVAPLVLVVGCALGLVFLFWAAKPEMEDAKAAAAAAKPNGGAIPLARAWISRSQST